MSGSVAPRRVGIKDVAEAAGVSITTVSHALSGKGRLTDQTRERVRRVAADLGYTPHPSARSLASGRTGMIATVVSLPGNAPIAFTQIDYYVAPMNAATRTAVGHGYALVVAPSTAGPQTWSQLPLDGVIVIDPADGDPTLPMLRGRGAPIVFVGRDPHGEPDDLVVENDRAAATRSVLDHLVDAGATRVGVVALRTFETFSEDAIAAYFAWCAERGADPCVHTVDADIYDDGIPIPAFNRTGPAYLFGGGIDVFRWSAAHTRVSVSGAYRISAYEFYTTLAPNIEPNSNTFSDLQLNVDGRSDIYRFDLSGWKVGLLVSVDL